MSKTTFFGIGAVVVLLTICLATVISNKGDAQNALLENKNTPIQISKIPVNAIQLPSEKGMIPIELNCKEAELSAPNIFENLSCIGINNTQKNITALVVSYTISMEEYGKPKSLSGEITILPLLSSAFFYYQKDSFIQPKQEIPINILQTTLDDSYVIKEMIIKIDYVEFENGSKVGENGIGEKIINQIRQGVSIYRNWLIEKYNEKGKSDEAITELLENPKNISTENLGNLTPKQFEGAKVFHKFLRRLYSTKGLQAINDTLKQ